MKFYVLLPILLLLTACDLRSEDGPFVGEHFTEPDAELVSAYWVYKTVDAETGLEIIHPIVGGQSPVVGTQIGLCINFRIRSGSDAKTLTYRVLDDAGNVILDDQKYRFRRDRDSDRRLARERSNRTNELIHLWHPAHGTKQYRVQIRYVNGFRDWNTANDSRAVAYTAVTINQNPQVVTHR